MEEIEPIENQEPEGLVYKSLNKSRMRATYWRKGEDGTWNPTTPLPADPIGQLHYFAKGFRVKPPNESVGSICSECGFEAKSDFGLLAHAKKHKKEEKT